MNEIGIGHNQPDMATTAAEVTMDLSAWLSEHPVIQTEEEAREAKLLADRSKLCVADLEDERKAKTIPLNEQVKKINDHYREPRSLLEKVLNVLQDRLSTFLRGEEERRNAKAKETAQLAEKAEQVARSLEMSERNAIHAASLGELGVDIATFTTQTDHAFSYAKKAAHQAAIAERETKVKIGGGFRMATSLHNKETLTVLDAVAAIQDIGLGNTIIDEAIVRASRAYRKVFGKLPRGIMSEIERKV